MALRREEVGVLASRISACLRCAMRCASCSSRSIGCRAWSRTAATWGPDLPGREPEGVPDGQRGESGRNGFAQLSSKGISANIDGLRADLNGVTCATRIAASLAQTSRRCAVAGQLGSLHRSFGGTGAQGLGTAKAFRLKSRGGIHLEASKARRPPTSATHSVGTPGRRIINQPAASCCTGNSACHKLKLPPRRAVNRSPPCSKNR
jgi:hypothetical protein